MLRSTFDQLFAVVSRQLVECRPCYGPYHPTTATPRPLKLFRRYTSVGAEKRELRPSSERERAKFIAMPFSFSSQLKIWSFHFVVVQRRQRKLQKSVMHVQSCCFAHKRYCVLDVPIAVAVVVL